MATLSVRNVRKSFEGGKPVLDGVSFDAADGEFVTLLGASGCGKSTLLRIVAGLETAESGQVLIDGRDCTRMSPKDRDVAMVFQSYALYPHLTVKENAALGLKLRGYAKGEIDTRVREAARMLELEPLLDRKPSALSGGQRQRAALARALVRRPKLFLLDEPLSNLDAALRERTRGELKLLFKRVKGTVLYVTHDQTEAMTLSDRVVLLDRGRVQQDAPPAVIYREPANTFVAGFLGSPPMNLFESQGVTVGIRPEDILISERPGEGFKEAAVTLAEPLGATTVLTLEVDGRTFRAVAPGTWNPLQTKAYARLPPEALHRFDPKSASRL